MLHSQRPRRSTPRRAAAAAAHPSLAAAAAAAASAQARRMRRRLRRQPNRACRSKRGIWRPTKLGVAPSGETMRRVSGGVGIKEQARAARNLLPDDVCHQHLNAVLTTWHCLALQSGSQSRAFSACSMFGNGDYFIMCATAFCTAFL
jgi:hypothetical protein